jgi:hypothetical protein
MVKRAEMGHIGEEEGRSRNRVAESDPSRANKTKRRFRCGAI